jgi:hypothetical protein
MNELFGFLSNGAYRKTLVFGPLYTLIAWSLPLANGDALSKIK